MAAPSEKFPKKEKVVLTPLQLLEQTRKDSATRHEKYAEKLRVNHRSLVKRITHAVQEITGKGAFMLRIPDAKLGIRTISYDKRGFKTSAITDAGATVSLSDQTHEYLLNLAEQLAKGKYALIKLDDDNAFRSYMSNVFQEQDNILLQQQSQREALVKEQDEKVEAAYTTFNNNLLCMLQKLQPLGLGLRLQSMDTQYDRKKLDLLSANKDKLTLSGGYTSTTDVRYYMGNIRKQLRAGTVTVVPIDYHF